MESPIKYWDEWHTSLLEQPFTVQTENGPEPEGEQGSFTAVSLDGASWVWPSQ